MTTTISRSRRCFERYGAMALRMTALAVALAGAAPRLEAQTVPRDTAQLRRMAEQRSAATSVRTNCSAGFANPA
jgi:hypothetical protein